MKCILVKLFWGEFNLMQKVKMHILCDLYISFLNVYPRETLTYVYKETNLRMFIEVLPIIMKKKKLPK